jgi:hypothetical protein
MKYFYLIQNKWPGQINIHFAYALDDIQSYFNFHFFLDIFQIFYQIENRNNNQKINQYLILNFLLDIILVQNIRYIALGNIHIYVFIIYVMLYIANNTTHHHKF